MTLVLQGASITLVGQFFEFAAGPPVDLTGATVAIESADGVTTVLAATSVGVAHPETGVYSYVWAVDVGQAPGGYLVTWAGTVAGNPISATELVTVAAIPTYAAALSAARRYDRVPYQATDAQNNPIPGAHFTLWDGVLGGNGANPVTNITALDGSPIPGGILVGDVRGYAPGFRDLDKTPNLYIIGSDTGVIAGVDPVLIEPSDTDDRVIAIEAYVTGPGGIGDRQDALDASRGQPGGIATLGADGRVPPAQLPSVLAGALGFAVTEYGAVGDGVTDDAPAIQSVLDLVAGSAPGARVIFPPGTYLVNSELEIKSSVHLDLTKGATIKRGSSSMQYVFKNFNSSYAPTLYGGRGGITVSGGTIDGNAAAFSSTVTAFIIAHCDTALFDGVTFQNVVDWHGLEINSSRNVVVRNCTFQGLRIVTAGRYISEACQIDLAKDLTVIPGIGAGALDNTPCNNVLITGNTVRASSAFGSFGCLTGSHSWTDGFKHTQIRVVDNHAKDLHDYMVNAFNWDDVTVANNSCTDSNSFLAFQLPTSGSTNDMFRLACTGNRVVNGGTQNANTGINANNVLVTGNNATAAGNVVREILVANNVFQNIANGGACLLFYNAADVMCAGNLVKSTTGTSTEGITVQGSAEGNYTGNRITDCSGRGINVLDDTNINSGFCTFVGNHIFHAGEEAIVVGSSEPTITGNHVVSPGTKAGPATAAVWLSSLASNPVFTGNKIRGSSPLPTTGVRMDTATVPMISANHITGWTVTTTAQGASGQNLWLATASKPTLPNAYNVC